MGTVKDRWNKVYEEEANEMIDFMEKEGLSMAKSTHTFLLFDMACNLKVIRLMLAEVLKGEGQDA